LSVYSMVAEARKGSPGMCELAPWAHALFPSLEPDPITQIPGGEPCLSHVQGGAAVA
jgi:hypothetical protein